MTVGGSVSTEPSATVDLRGQDWGVLGRALDGGGRMGELIRARDWAATPLGPPGQWSTSLRSAVALCVSSRFPMRLFWGPELVMIYNDAYSPIPGDKHPACLGRPCAEVWPEVWDDVGPLIAGVLDGGPGTWSEDHLLVLNRHGYPEECYFTLSYSPVFDDDGSVGGVMAAVSETTGRVLTERRLGTLRLLSDRVGDARTEAEVCQRAVEAIASDDADLPFAALYLADDRWASLGLTASEGTPVRAWPASVGRDAAAGGLDASLWSVLEYAAVVVEEVDVDTASGRRSMFMVPVVYTDAEGPLGVLVLCVNPRRRLDRDLRDFVDLVAAHVATALAAQRRAARREALAAASLALSGVATLGAVLDTVTEQSRALVGALDAAVDLEVGDGWEGAITPGGPSPQPRTTGSRADDLVVPLVGRDGQRLGALRVGERVVGRYTPDDEAVLAQFAQMASARIENTRLYERERDVAVALQRSLLPQAMPPAPGLVVASRYLPGADGTEVGGDWYDVIELPDRCTGLVIGDVLGRGVRAAAVMGQLRAVLRAYALEGLAPAALLTRLDLVVRSFDETQLTTCTYAIYDPARRTLTMATAGHLPPVVISPGGGALLLELDPGLPLGAGGNGVEPDYRDVVLGLAPGSSMLLFTDGLIEERGRSLGQGLEQLREAVGWPGTSAEELCDRALQALGRDLAHDDDTALLAVRSLPGDDRGEGVGVIELGASLRSPQRARRFVRARLESHAVAAAVADSAELLVSELVTNVIVHAENALSVSVAITDTLVSIAVHDADAVIPRSGLQADSLAEGGRGLALVDQVASRWGADLLPDGKRVWFELDLT
ncbi:MAG TPA: SpoIIE family protein phosphatase [Actinomycetales bacterium]|nr:SpoIIE family protein phosphatase [Actinomycetales bacterium]